MATIDDGWVGLVGEAGHVQHLFPGLIDQASLSEFAPAPLLQHDFPASFILSSALPNPSQSTLMGDIHRMYNQLQIRKQKKEVNGKQDLELSIIQTEGNYLTAYYEPLMYWSMPFREL